MRPIDADALIETINENAKGNEGWYGDTWQFMRDIENAPTIDAVSVVMCKDCRWQEECVITELWGGGNGYCRSGERKDDETDITKQD